jgi:hypothetical protein
MRAARLIRIVLLSAGAVALYGIGKAAYFFHLAPVSVRVLDYDTERPVTSAVVAARWYRVAPFCIHGDCIRGEAASAEAQTNADGVAVLTPPRARRQGLTVTRNEPRVFVHSVGAVVAARVPAAPNRHETYFVLAPSDFVAGPTILAQDVLNLDSDYMLPLGVRASSFPLLSAAIRRTIRESPPLVREQLTKELARSSRH